MTLAALGRWGVVHRVWVRGQRREHYEAETDFWKMISGVLNERERREIGAAVEAVERGEASARAALAAAQGGERRRRQEAQGGGRLHGRCASGGCNEICKLGETMLNMLLGQLTLDVGKFRDLLRVEAARPAAGRWRRRAGAGAAPAARGKAPPAVKSPCELSIYFEYLELSCLSPPSRRCPRR